ncbi:MAG TPA: DMT family transporter [Alphaproteobacteria bacterium]|jgi:drug/metabolite transporter (DMT)-like permease|nr:DMT family transporter [Alphaproteobacteria bacterium]
MIRAFNHHLPPALRGMVLMVISGAMFTAMHATIRLVSAEGPDGGLHPFEIAFFRNFFGLVVLLPVLLRTGVAALRTEHFGMHALRSGMQSMAMLMFFTALTLSPLADIAALSFLAPLFATVGAALVLREVVRLRRWSALIIGFAGAMVVLGPGFQEISQGLLLVVVSSAVWGATMLIIKNLGRTDSSLTITAYMALLMTPITLVPALFVWRLPTLVELAGLAVLAALGTVGHLAMAQSFKEADASAVLPFEFTRLIWAALFGFWLFAEVPGLRTWIGGAMIFASVTYVAYREAQLRGDDDGKTDAAVDRL